MPASSPFVQSNLLIVLSQRINPHQAYHLSRPYSLLLLRGLAKTEKLVPLGMREGYFSFLS